MARELLKGVLAIVASTLGLLIIAIFYEVAIEMADAWWQWAVGMTVATALALFGLLLIAAAMAATVGVTAAGWIGMLSGRVPHGFGARDGNLGRAFGNLALFAAAVYLGLRLYRVGRVDGQLNWAVEGLFLAGAGVVFGLLPAVPRIYFARRGRGDPVEPARAKRRRRSKTANAAASHDGVTVLVTCAMLGIALSMCTANTVMAVRARDGVAALPYADWLEGCLDPDGDVHECAARAALTLIPRRTTRLRLETISNCDVALRTTAGDDVPVLGYEARKRLGIPSSSGTFARNRIVFDPQPGVTFRVDVTAADDRACVYSVRYLDEPTGPGDAPR